LLIAIAPHLGQGEAAGDAATGKKGRISERFGRIAAGTNNSQDKLTRGGAMEVIYSDRARQDRKGYALMQKATKLLEESVRASPDRTPIVAEWDRLEEERGVLYTLRLSDFAGEATMTFSPEELEGGTQTELRLYKVLGDLLRIRSHRLLEKVLQNSGPEE
jgi:hypothetical protein